MEAEFSSLSELYFSLHAQMIMRHSWTDFDDNIYRVDWTPWSIWGPIGYTPGKLTQLVSQSIDPEELHRTRVRIDRCIAMHKSSDVYTVAMQFGRHTAGKVISPLRYKLGACLSTVIFRIYKGVHAPPLIIWRTTEITRRLIADWVMLDNIWSWVGMDATKVHMIFGSKWIANFNLQVLDRLAPYLVRSAKESWWHLFRPTKVPPTYRARAIAWRVAQNIKRPMFIGQDGILSHKFRKSDFPQLEMPHV